MTEQAMPDSRLGRVLQGQYRLDRLLGEGGMGAVYRGEQLSVSRPVAIKLIAGKVAENPECVRRFRREAEAMARLRHPNTVRLFDFGVADDPDRPGTDKRELYMVMELLEGSDLSELIVRRQKLPPKEALAITRQVLEALAEAHALGIVHRDLKPANIFLSQVHGGTTMAKVMDFGIAGIEQQNAASTKLTSTGAVMGTPAYMSPEQAQGKTVDARSDLYSLGVVLFEMLVGRPPFEADSAVSLLLAQVSTQPPRLRELLPELAELPAVQQLLDVLLDKNPERRPSSAQATIELLDQVTARLAPGSGAVPALPPVDALSDTRSTQAQGTFTSLQPGSKRPWWLLLPAAGLVLGATLLLKPTKESTPPPLPEQSAKLPGAPVVPNAPHLFTVQLVSKPAGAAVELAGVEIGKTPYAVQFRRATTLRFVMAGYNPHELSVDENSEPIMVVELSPAPNAKKSTRKEPAVHAPATLAAGAPAASPVPTAVSPAAVAAPATTPPPAAPRAAQSNPNQIVLPAPAWLANAARPLLAPRDRREAMLRSGPPYRNVVAAKRAYREGRLSEDVYEDNIWALKTIRSNRITAEKQAYKAGRITRDELERRIDRIDAEYEGK